jgi:integrase
MCADAIEDGFLVVNPAQGLSRRGRSGPGTISQAERQASIRPLSVSQLDTFLSTVRDAGAPQEAVLFLTLADAGLRPGEALALRWTDLDVATQEILVERALAGTTIKPTKTYTRRRVELTPRLLTALEDWQAAREAEALAANREPVPWLFTDPAGRPLTIKHVAWRFQFLCRRAGLPRFRLYDLRHSYATHLLAESAPITYVATQMGHSKPTTTLGFYAHWLPTPERVWAGRLQALRQGLSVHGPVGNQSRRESRRASRPEAGVPDISR